jgi:hypothetical protein
VTTPTSKRIGAFGARLAPVDIGGETVSLWVIEEGIPIEVDLVEARRV